jgi:hypothetical protein
MSSSALSESAYQTLAQVEDAHYALLALHDSQTPDPRHAPEGSAEPDGADVDRARLIPVYEELKAFLRNTAATGAYLDEYDARLSAQAKLDYWANLCYSAGFDQPRAVLAPYDPALLPKLRPDQCPYLGLDAFDQAHAGVFFGRTDQIDTLLQRLAAGARLLVVTGRSGSGKSSLVLAGLLPALAGGAVDGSARWRLLPPLVPGTAPLHHLLRALQSVCLRLQEPQEFDAELSRLRREPARLLELLDEVPDGLPPGTPVAPALLVVDQFEEALTQRIGNTEADFDAFVAALLALIDCPAPAHRVVLTMRRDVDAKLAAIYPQLNRRYNQGAGFAVSAMDSQQLQDAILRPAATIGLRFQDGIVEDLVGSVLGEDTGLPLLQFALMALWDQRPAEGNLITHEALRQVGKPRSAMAQAAENLYRDLNPEQQMAAQKLLPELARVDDGTVFRKRVTRGHLRKLVDNTHLDALLHRLQGARLLRISGDRHQEADGDLVEVAHEALLRNWQRLDRWLQERSREVERRTLLRKLAELWQASPAEPDTGRPRGFDYLLTGLALKEADAAFARVVLEPLETEFLTASHAAEQWADAQRLAAQNAQAKLERDQAALDKRRHTVLALTLAWAVALLTITAILLGYAWQRTQKELRDSQAESGRLQRSAEGKEQSADKQLIRASELKAEAQAQVDRASIQAEHKIAEAKLDAKRRIVAADVHARRVQDQAATQKRKADELLAKTSAEWGHAEAGRLISEAHRVESSDSAKAIEHVVGAFKADPASLPQAAGPLIEALRYRRAMLELPRELVGPLEALSLSPDGQRLLAVDGSVLTEWDISSAHPKPLQRQRWDTRSAHEVFDAAYASGDQDVALISNHGVWLWRPGAAPRQLGDVRNGRRLQFSQDGRLLAVVTDDDARVLLWDVASGALLLDDRPFQNHPTLSNSTLDNVTFLEATGHNHLVAVAEPSGDGLSFRQPFAAYVLRDGRPAPQADVVATLPPCQAPSTIYASGGGMAGWSLPQHACIHKLAAVLAGTDSRVDLPLRDKAILGDFLVRTDGRHLVQLMRHGNEARVLDLRDNRTLRLQGGFDQQERASHESFLAVSADGRRLAFAARTGAIRVFDLTNEAEPAVVHEQTAWVSDDEQWHLVRRAETGVSAFELRRLGGGEPVRRFDLSKEFLREAQSFALSPDGKHLTFLGECADVLSQDTCAVSYSVDSAAPAVQHQFRPAVTLSLFGLTVARPWSIGDLLLVRQGEHWRVLRGGAQAALHSVPVEASSQGSSSSVGRQPPIFLANDQRFAVRRVTDAGAEIDLYDASGEGALRVDTLRYAQGPLDLWFHDEGRFLVVQQGEQAHLHELQATGAGKPIVLPAGTVGSRVLVDGERKTVVLRQPNQPPQVLRLPGLEPIADLPAGALVDPRGRYAWSRKSGGGWTLRAVSQPATELLSFGGASPELVFSQDGRTLVIRQRDDNKLMVYRLPKGELLLETAADKLPLALRERWLTARGSWLRDADGRLVPADAQRLLEMARQRARP